MTQTTTDQTSANAEITELFADVCPNWDRGDGPGIASHYATDGRLISPFGDDAKGREAIAELFAAVFAGPMTGSTSTIEVQDVRLLTSEFAVVDGTQLVEIPPLAEPLRLHFTAVVRNGSEGWQIVDCRPYAFISTPG